jgi:putative flippase GtrA
MEIMAHRARYAAAMAAITSRLPFGLSRVVEPSMLGYLLINLCTFFVDLALLALLHGRERLPIPVAVTISYGTASLISYVLNRVLNFRSHADVGRQLPVFIAVSASNYLIFVLGLTDLLSAVGVYYELSRVLAACCEAVYLYCMLRWVVFRDTAGGTDDLDVEAALGAAAEASETAELADDPGEAGKVGGADDSGGVTPESESAASAPRPATTAGPEARPR